VTLETGAGIGAEPAPANLINSLWIFKAKATCYRDCKYGGSLGYFATWGSAHAGLYGSGADGSGRRPDSNGYIAEVDYLPVRNVRLMLQYTGYGKFDGVASQTV
jgi:hypothetical protein